MRPDDTSPKTQETPARYTIDELAALAGVTRRTVRYYVSRGLLPAPEGLGRGAHYHDGHLARLMMIRDRQMAGEPLARIEAELSGNSPELSDLRAEASMETWTRLVLADGVELHLRGIPMDAARAGQLRLAVLQVLDRMKLP